MTEEEAKKTSVRTIYKVAAFIAFILLGCLGLRGYSNSVEKLKLNKCVDELSELVLNIQQAYQGAQSYSGLDYKTADAMNLFPQKMRNENYSEAVNGYDGGVDLYSSSLNEEGDARAFEISFQGVTEAGCRELIRLNWGDGVKMLISVAGFTVATPSYVMDDIYQSTKASDIKRMNVFLGEAAHSAPQERLDRICKCQEDSSCTVVWKFR